MKHQKPNLRKTRVKFIEQSNDVHNNKYNYDLVVYVRNEDYVIIECPNHGYFLQSPKTHITGRGCKKCAGEKRRLTNSEFIDRSNKIHKGFYLYPNTKYKTVDDKVLIVCQKHGEFTQAARDHLAGSGCTECSNSLTSWSKSQYLEMSKPYDFKSKIYLVKMNLNNEYFYKIGITVTSLNERYWGVKPYSVETIAFIEMKADVAWEKEKELHRMVRDIKYKPIFKFGGHTECFSELTQEIKDFFGVSHA
jgi:hypothetical protein